ncbi:MAG: DUF2273 domain-containing protein [Clostridiaceae bacterium]|nr:DUF2273 domain-containing protein [Eubacteriales bacterium]
MEGFAEFFKKYKWRVLLVAFGVLFAILIFSIGFWRTLLLFFIIAVCLLFGTLLDQGGRERVRQFFGALFKSK